MHETTPERPPVDRFVWERALRASDVTGNAMLVLLTLATHMNRDGTEGRPSQATLAAQTGLSDRSVRRYLAAAVDDEWLTKVSRGHRRGDGQAMASVYQTSLPVTCDRKSVDSTGQECPEEDYLYRPDAASLPAKSATSTGHPWPPTKPLDQEENKGDPDRISERHKAAAADGLRAYREAVGREAS